MLRVRSKVFSTFLLINHGLASFLYTAVDTWVPLCDAHHTEKHLIVEFNANATILRYLIHLSRLSYLVISKAS